MAHSSTDSSASNGDRPSASGPYAIVEAFRQKFWLQPNRTTTWIGLQLHEVDEDRPLEQVLLIVTSQRAQLGLPCGGRLPVTLKVVFARRDPRIIVYKNAPKKENQFARTATARKTTR